MYKIEEEKQERSEKYIETLEARIRKLRETISDKHYQCE